MPTKTATESSNGGTATAPSSPRVKVRQTKMLIDGKWVDSRQRQDVRDDQPRHRRGHRQRRRGRQGRRRPGRQGRPQGVREGPVAEDGRPRARPAAQQAGRPDRGEHRRAGRARDRSTTASRSRDAHGRRPAADDRLLPLLRRLGRQDPRQDDPDRRPVLLLHAARAGRRRRADHPVELPAADAGVEVGPGPGGRLHGRAEARRADAADRPARRRAGPGSRLPRRRHQRRPRLRRDRRRGRSSSIMDVDKVAFTGAHRGRQAHHAGRRADATSSASRSSWAARARTSSSPTPTSTPPSRARTSACSSTRASAAAPAAGCSSRRRSTTSSSRRCSRR